MHGTPRHAIPRCSEALATLTLVNKALALLIGRAPERAVKGSRDHVAGHILSAGAPR